MARARRTWGRHCSNQSFSSCRLPEAIVTGGYRKNALRENENADERSSDQPLGQSSSVRREINGTMARRERALEDVGKFGRATEGGADVTRTPAYRPLSSCGERLGLRPTLHCGAPASQHGALLC